MDGISMKIFTHKSPPVSLPLICCRGFTLIELMVTLSVFGILMVTGVPALKTFIDSNELVAETNRMMGSLSAARVEAVKRNMNTVLCPSTNQTSCNGTSWANGWITFADTNADGVLANDGSEIVFAVAEASSGTLRLYGDTNLAKSIRYKADGTLMSNVGTLTVCSTGSVSPNGRAIAITSGGRARTDSTTVSSCK
jgi:type IV fimbrial biogenesis protein FimT